MAGFPKQDVMMVFFAYLNLMDFGEFSYTLQGLRNVFTIIQPLHISKKKWEYP